MSPEPIESSANGGNASPFPANALGVTVAQIAAALQVSVKTARRMDGERLIPGRFRVGRAVRFNRDLVLKWLAEGCPTPRKGR